MPDSSLSNIVRRIVTMLVDEDYMGLESLSNGRLMKASDMDQVIRDYGEKLIMPPDDAFENLDVIEIAAAQPPEWSVWFHLWTVREGKSDLSLLLNLTEITKEEFEVEIEDIHVL